MWSNQTMDTIGTRLRDHRTRRQLSIYQLGKAASVGPHQIHKYEREIHEPTAAVLRRLADALDLTIDELVP